MQGEWLHVACHGLSTCMDGQSWVSGSRDHLIPWSMQQFEGLLCGEHGVCQQYLDPSAQGSCMQQHGQLWLGMCRPWCKWRYAVGNWVLLMFRSQQYIYFHQWMKCTKVLHMSFATRQPIGALNPHIMSKKYHMYVLYVIGNVFHRVQLM